MAYTIVNPPNSGFIPIANIDIGLTTAYGSSTLYPTPPAKIGAIVQAVDPTLGQGEFIFLYGVASLAVGSLVSYNGLTGLTTLAPNTADIGSPLAVSMSANTSTTLGSWFQISGVAVIKKTAIKISPSVKIYVSATAGSVTSTAATGTGVWNAVTVNAATVASATGTVQVQINRPMNEGYVS
jgi:hypothetical protein